MTSADTAVAARGDAQTRPAPDPAFDQRRRLSPRLWDTDWLVLRGMRAVIEAQADNIAKAGLDQMARTAATELLGHKIRVNVLYPGWTDTPGERKFFSEETIKVAGQQLPAGRLATSEEIAHAALFLVDPRSEYINGTTLEIEGGLALPWWSNRDKGDF